jgi:hypothetical protein
MNMNLFFILGCRFECHLGHDIEQRNVNSQFLLQKPNIRVSRI